MLKPLGIDRKMNTNNFHNWSIVSILYLWKLRKALWRHLLGTWETVVGIFHHLLTFYRINSSSFDPKSAKWSATFLKSNRSRVYRGHLKAAHLLVTVSPTWLSSSLQGSRIICMQILIQNCLPCWMGQRREKEREPLYLTSLCSEHPGIQR